MTNFDAHLGRIDKQLVPSELRNTAAIPYRLAGMRALRARDSRKLPTEEANKMRSTGTLAVAVIFAAAPLAGIHMLDGRIANTLLRGGELELVVMLLFSGAMVQVVGALFSRIAYASASNGTGATLSFLPLLKDVLVNSTSIAAFAYAAWLAISASPKI